MEIYFEIKYINQWITIGSIFLGLIFYLSFIFFPHKIKSFIFIDKIYGLLSLLLPTNIIANKLKNEILKRYKIDFIPYGELSVDEFLNEYKILYKKDSKESIFQKIINLLKDEKNYKALIYGDGGMGKSATALKILKNMKIFSNFRMIII